MKRTAFLIGLCIASAAFAADKGGPPQKINAQGNPVPVFTGCYAQGHGSIATFQADNVSDVFKRFGLGAGCDIQADRLIVGGGVSYDFGLARELALNGRVGMTINPYLFGYGIASLRMDGIDPKPADAILAAGVGVEAYASKNLAIFLEATKDVKSFGVARDLDEAWQVRIGGRYRFGGPAW
jgi:hypothetical protein